MVAINTDYKNDIPSMDAIEEQVRKIAEVGFSYVQWVHDWEGEYMYCDIEMVQIKELLKKYNLKAKGIHATEGGCRQIRTNGKITGFNNRYRNLDNRKDYTSANEYTRLAGVELIKNRIDLAYMIEAKEIILHMQLPYMELRESGEAKKIYWEQVFKSFDELEPYCKAKGVKIAVENVICTPFEEQVEQFDKLFERYDFDFLGFCFDSGHGSIVSLHDYLAFAERYKDRLIALHLQDTDSIPPELADDDVAVLKADSHRVPFTGVIDWDRLAKIIAESPYELPITLEVGIPSDTLEKEMANLKDAREKGEKFNEMVKNYRK